MRRLKKLSQNLALIALGLALAAVICEVALRLYNPFHFRVRLGRIDLLTNIKFQTSNPEIAKLDQNIVHTKNSLGFRGEPPPPDFARWLTIVAVGGSTTECFYVSDGKTWEDVLAARLQEHFRQVWVNNAGLDGHSTFGHLLLMRDYLSKLQPKCVLFMAGINDMGRKELGDFELGRQGLHVIQPKNNWSSWLVQHSEFWSLAVNLSRYLEGYRRGLVHRDLVLADQERLDHVDAPRAQNILNVYREEYLPPYSRRLTALVQLAKENGIEPVLITQPALFGDAVDPGTGVNLGTLKMMGQDINGKLQWEILELYNEATRHTGRRENLLVIDLARKLPKDSRYHYDYFHFTNAGCVRVGEIIAQELTPWLAARFPQYLAPPGDGAVSHQGDH